MPSSVKLSSLLGMIYHHNLCLLLLVMCNKIGLFYIKTVLIIQWAPAMRIPFLSDCLLSSWVQNCSVVMEVLRYPPKTCIDFSCSSLQSQQGGDHRKIQRVSEPLNVKQLDILWSLMAPVDISHQAPFLKSKTWTVCQIEHDRRLHTLNVCPVCRSVQCKLRGIYSAREH